MGDPAVTVVVVALLEGAPLRACLAAVRAQTPRILAILRDGSVQDAEGVLRGRSAATDVPARRRCGAELAATRVVAFLEDSVLPAPGWVEAVAMAFRDPRVGAVGGPITIDPALPASSRALALTEYGRYSAARVRGPAPAALPGCNFAFARTPLLAAMPDEGLVDNEVYERLAVHRFQLAWAPGMAVSYAAPHSDGAALGTRFRHGRIYAGRRLAQGGVATRFAGALKALLLPPLLVARSVREAMPAERRSPATLTCVALQQTSWAFGELVGAVAGPPRDGMASW